MKININFNIPKFTWITGLAMFLFTAATWAQVSIVGDDSFTVGDRTTFSLSSPAGTDTQWFLGPGSGQATIVSSNDNAARVEFTGSGTVVISATILDDTVVLHQLTKNVSVSGGVPNTPGNPTIVSNNCSAPVLQRVGWSGDFGDTWYWQGKTANGTHTNKGSGINYTATEGSGTYYIRARSTTGEWSPNSGSVTVTVNNLQAGSISGNQTICYGTDPSNLSSSSAASNGDTYSYQWQVSTNNSSWSNVSGATGASYNPSTNLTSDRWYRRGVTSCSGQTLYTSSVKVTVRDPLDPGSLDPVITVCYNGNPPEITSAANASHGNGSYSYQWETSSNGTSWNPISGATQSTYDPPSGLTTPTWYRRQVSSCGQTAVTAGVLINVYDPLSAGDIQGNQTLCYGENPTTINNLTSPSGGKNDYVYSWQASPNGVDSWITISGANSISYTPAANATASLYYRRGVNSCNGTLYSQSTILVDVIPLLNAPTGALTASTCSGESATLTLSPDAAANSVRWYDASTGGNLLSEGNNFNTPVLSSNTTYYASSYDSVNDCESTARTQVDVTISSLVTYYLDQDGDGLGDPTQSFEQCGQPSGYVANADDVCPNDPTNTCDDPAVDPVGDNYVYTRSYQKSSADMLAGGQDQNNFAFFNSSEDVIQQITYFDGIGRPVQQIALEQSPLISGTKKDIVTQVEYDDYGRTEKEWLPYAAATGTFGAVKTGVTQANLDYYNVAKYDNTTNPYSQKKFDNSPLNRVEKQAAPGEDWKLGSGHEIDFEYTANTATDAVRHFSVNITQTGDTYVPTLVEQSAYLEYGVGELFKSITYDENHDGTSTKNHTTEEYTDKLGRVILKRTFSDADLNNDKTIGAGETEVAHDTYYVYDDYGNLSYVLPPKMDASSAAIATINGNLNALGYQYVYDYRNRLVEKRLPGKEWEYIVYNKLDQPILTQDANQRAKDAGSDEWLFTKYDAFGRVAYTGMAQATEGATRASIQTEVDGLAQLWEIQTATDQDDLFTENVSIYYSNNAYPNNSLQNRIVDLVEVLTINYYDRYDWQPSSLPTAPSTVFGTSLDSRVHGMATGSRIKVLETSHWITTVTRYDSKARPLYTYSENELLGTSDQVESLLDFVGRPLTVRSAHTKGGNTVVTIDNFEYDHVGRMLKQTQCIGNQTLGYSCSEVNVEANPVVNDPVVTQGTIGTQSVTIANPSPSEPVVITGGTFKVDPNAGSSGGDQELIVYHKYDELGQMEAKKVGGATNTTYDLTAGLQTVDYRYNVRGWLTDINDVTDTTPDKLFNFSLVYNGSSNPLYNGNIARAQWRTDNADKGLKQYDYTYDALNRITGATSSDTNYNLAWVGYDKNGNIGRLERNGHTNAAASTFGLMDDMEYTYTGNQLQAVDDDALASATQGFVDRVEQTTEYHYDDNGNMTQDDNKGITAITYNHLNLPTSIAIQNGVDNGTISYIYDATGTKLRKTVGSSVTDYAGNYVYTNTSGPTVLEFLNHSEGYASPDGQGSYDYIYQYKDHLGNVRLSYTDVNQNTTDPVSLEIVEENNYYPFGLKHKGYNDGMSALGNNVAQKWKYNGVELENALELELYEMPLRQFDAVLGRFTSIDPVVHHSYSPYQGYDNNPIFWADPSGANSVANLLGQRYGADGLTNDQWLELSRGGGGVNATDARNTARGNMSDLRRINQMESYARENRIGVGTVETNGGHFIANFSDECPECYRAYFNSMANRMDAQINELKNVNASSEDNSNFLTSTGYAFVVAGSLYSVGELVIDNPTWGYWLDSRGKFRSYSLIEKGSNGKYLRGVQGYRYGIQYAQKYASYWKLAGKVTFYGGVVISGIQGIGHLENGNYEGAVRSGMDIVMGRVSLMGPWGALIGGSYFLAAWATDNGYIRHSEYKRDWSVTCFVAGTKILMKDGSHKNIENIVAGDIILSTNMDTMEIEEDTVVVVPSKEEKYNKIYMKYSNGVENIASGHHPFYVKGKGWSVYDVKMAQQDLTLDVHELELGDTVYFYSDGILKEVKIVELKNLNEEELMYNIKYVEKNNTFFANGILVHNRYENK